jgi:hypothetical protein
VREAEVHGRECSLDPGRAILLAAILDRRPRRVVLHGGVRGAQQLPGPALGEWLVYALRADGAGVLAGTGCDRLVLARVVAVAAAEGWPVLGPGELRELGALVVVRALGGAEVEPEVARAVPGVRPGGWVVELGHPPALLRWRPWTWPGRTRLLRTAAELRAQAWLGLGLFAVEQWAPVDAPRVLVTCGRRRAIPERR